MSFVIGGAASGKSRFAERLMLAAACRPEYVATMRRSGDPELHDKIIVHELARAPDWSTREVPLDLVGHLGEPLARAAREGLCDGALIDCATLWLANLLDAGRDPEAEGEALAGALARAPVSVVIVSNELGHGLVPMDRASRAFRDAHGRLNQRLAAASGLVVLVVAGLPLALKGTLPEGLGA